MAVNTPTPLFVQTFRPYSNITPFTYRDGLTYLEVLEKFRCYITDVLVPHVDSEVAELVSSWQLNLDELEANWEIQSTTLTDFVNSTVTTLTDSVNSSIDANHTWTTDQIATFQSTLDDAINSIINSTIAVTDPVIVGVFGNTESASRLLTDSLYAGKSTQTTVESGRLSQDTLDTRFNTLVGVAGDQTSAINTFLSLTTSLGIKRLIGNYSVSGTLTIPNGVYVDATNAVFTQTGSMKSTFLLGANSRLVGGSIIGKGASEWVNTSAVYAACGVFVNGDNIIVKDVHVSNMAGAGVYSSSPASNLTIKDCYFTGVGAPTIMPGLGGQYSAGVAINNSNSTNIKISGGNIEGFAQGIVIGSVSKLFIGGGISISSSGQHCIYLSSLVSGTISNIILNGAGLEGVKVQISDTSPYDSDSIVIGDIVMANIPSHGVHIANAQASPINHAKNIVIHDIVVKHGAGSVGSSFILEYANNVTIHDVVANGGNTSLDIRNSDKIKVHDTDFSGTNNSPVALNSVTNSQINVSAKDCCVAANSATQFGIYVTGASSNLKFRACDIQDSTTNTLYAIYIASGDLTTMRFVDNFSSGVQYGFRSATTTNTAIWIGNDLNGSVGRYFNQPTNAGPIADTSGATLAALETEVNKLKARMRLTFDIA